MSAKRGETYRNVLSFLKRRFRFELIKACIIAMRGYKKPPSTPAKIEMYIHTFKRRNYLF